MSARRNAGQDQVREDFRSPRLLDTVEMQSSEDMDGVRLDADRTGAQEASVKARKAARDLAIEQLRREHPDRIPEGLRKPGAFESYADGKEIEHTEQAVIAKKRFLKNVQGEREEEPSRQEAQPEGKKQEGITVMGTLNTIRKNPVTSLVVAALSAYALGIPLARFAAERGDRSTLNIVEAMRKFLRIPGADEKSGIGVAPSAAPPYGGFTPENMGIPG